ncbi:serine hydrolase domain-containing protein [Rhodopseudomonas sp. RCAM05734]|uniref:serine hydrolase domain-containing protein n=1 Tax=Rhodopseudomonas sp. RCAM05734 TaxID=3457549 RepID=UPI00404497FA
MKRIRVAYTLVALTLSGLSAYDLSLPAYGADDQKSMSGAAIKLGFSAERLQRLSTGLDRKIAEKAWPGSVTLIARDGRLVHFEAHGTLDQAGKTPMPTNAIFRIMSMTKPVVNVTAMALWEQGLFNLDDPVDKLLPELKVLKVVDPKSGETVPLVRSITIYDLLRHVSGFTYAFAAQDPSRPEHVKTIAKEYTKVGIQTNITPEEFLNRLAAIPLIQQPNTAFEYGVSTDVLGVLLERMTGKRLDRLVKEIVLDPLRMQDSGFEVPASKLTRLADAYDADRMKSGLWSAVEPTRTDKAYSKASNGMFSTASDYFRFAQMLMNEGELDGVRILSPKTIRFMTSDHIQGLGGSTASVAGPGYGFGLGFAVRRQAGMAVVPGNPGDFNWPGIAGTSFTVDPKDRIVAVMMVQAPSNRIQARHFFKDMLYSSIVRD